MRGSRLVVAILIAATLHAPGAGGAALEQAPGTSAGVAFHPGDIAGGWVRQPGGPFVLVAFPIQHGVDYIGIAYEDTVATRDSAWAPDRRFWQERAWCADVTALVWSPRGTSLYVSTGGHRGGGEVFRLELRARRAVRIWPNDQTSQAEQGPGRACEIMGVDLTRRILRVRYVAARGRDPILVEVGL